MAGAEDSPAPGAGGGHPVLDTGTREYNPHPVLKGQNCEMNILFEGLSIVMSTFFSACAVGVHARSFKSFSLSYTIINFLFSSEMEFLDISLTKIDWW